MSSLTEKIVGLTALAGLITFVSVLVWFVAEIDLTIIVVGSVALACFDFYQTLFKKKAED